MQIFSSPTLFLKVKLPRSNENLQHFSISINISGIKRSDKKQFTVYYIKGVHFPPLGFFVINPFRKKIFISNQLMQLTPENLKLLRWREVYRF